MTPSMVAAWIEDTDWKTLERRIRNFSSENKDRALQWARAYAKDPDGDRARSKLSVAVIGTLAPDEIDN